MKGSPSDPINVHDAEGGFVRQFAFEMPEHTGQALVQGVTDDLRGDDTRDFLSFGERQFWTRCCHLIMEVENKDIGREWIRGLEGPENE